MAFSDGTLQIVASGPRSDERWMKIAAYNINNIKRRLPNLLDWLKASKPDVVCLQELKCSEREFPAAPIKEAGYSAVSARREDLERRRDLGATPRTRSDQHSASRRFR